MWPDQCPSSPTWGSTHLHTTRTRNGALASGNHFSLPNTHEARQLRVGHSWLLEVHLMLSWFQWSLLFLAEGTKKIPHNVKKKKKKSWAPAVFIGLVLLYFQWRSLLRSEWRVSAVLKLICPFLAPRNPPVPRPMPCTPWHLSYSNSTKGLQA